MEKKKRKWYQKKRSYVLMALSVIWAYLYRNYPKPILIISFPFFVLIWVYVAFSLIVFWVAIIYKLITGKTPTWIE